MSLMSKIILISRVLGDYQAALLDDDVLAEIAIEQSCRPSLLGDIYWAKVSRVLAGMGSAFVDIGQEKMAFLPLDDKSCPHQKHRLQAGDWLMVQVVKEPIGDKGARLTTDIVLAGHYLLYLPMSVGELGVSNKLRPAKRRQLKQILQTLLESSIQGGLVARSATTWAGEDELVIESQNLSALWQQILAQKTASHQTKNKRAIKLWSRPTLPKQCLLDWAEPDTQVLVDDWDTYRALEQFCQQWLGFLVGNITYHDPKQRALFECYGVDTALQNALQKRVALPLGADVFIEQTEAMTIIDVNSGSFVDKYSSKQTAYQTNLYASKIIAEQLRLRQIGGIIIIDFIDMNDPVHQDNVLKELKKHLASDPAKTSIHSISLGLVVMTRKRTRQSLSKQLCQPCPTCHGTGTIKSIEMVAFEIYRELMRVARVYPSCQSLTVLVDGAVAEFLHTVGATTELSALLDKEIKLQVQTMTCHEQYQVIFS